MIDRRLLGPALLALALKATAGTLTLGVLARADDERLLPSRTELAYPGHPGGPIIQAVEMAVNRVLVPFMLASMSPSLPPQPI